MYVPVADPESLAYRFCGVFRLDLEDPETELRDGVAVVEDNVGNCAQSSVTPSSIATASQIRRDAGIPRSAGR